jgi:hypothetical protein
LQVFEFAAAKAGVGLAVAGCYLPCPVGIAVQAVGNDHGGQGVADIDVLHLGQYQ